MLDLKKMKKKRAEIQRGGDFWSPQDGETRVYIGGPCRGTNDKYEPTAGLNFVEVGVHFKVGKDNATVVCLDSEQNPIITHPFVVDLMKKRGVKIVTDKHGHSFCPVCEAIQNGEVDGEDAQDSRFQVRYMYWVIPIDHRRTSADGWSKLAPKPSPYSCGPTVHDGFLEALTENDDITNVDGAVLVRLGKTGKGMTTKYKIAVDVNTLKKPLRLDKSTQRMIIESTKIKGGCDLFNVVANMTKGTAEVKAAIAGVKTEQGDEGEEQDGSGAKACYGKDYEEGSSDCEACEHKDDCAKEMEPAEVEEEEEQAEEAAEEEEAAEVEATEEEAAEEEEQAEEEATEEEAEEEQEAEEEAAEEEEQAEEEEATEEEAEEEAAEEEAEEPPKPKPKPAAKPVGKPAGKPVTKPVGKPGIKPKPKSDDDGIEELASQLKKLGKDKKKGK